MTQKEFKANSQSELFSNITEWLYSEEQSPDIVVENIDFSGDNMEGFTASLTFKGV